MCTRSMMLKQKWDWLQHENYYIVWLIKTWWWEGLLGEIFPGGGGMRCVREVKGQGIWNMGKSAPVAFLTFFKKKVSGEIDLLSLACFMYKHKSLEAGQLPREHLSLLWNLLHFIITTYLKPYDDSSVCIDK